MRKSFQVIVSVAMVVGVALLGALANPVTPANVEITCLRDTGSSSPISAITYYQGNTLSISNSVMYTGETTNSPVQDLTNCVITVQAGQPGVTNNVTAVGYIVTTNDGVFGAEFIIPPYNPCYIEVTVSNTFIYTYPRYRITTQAQLP